MTEIIFAIAGCVIGAIIMFAACNTTSADLYAENEHLKRQLPRRGPHGRFVKHKEAGR